MTERTPRPVVEWLTEGHDAVPADLTERTLIATRHIRQRPAWTFLDTWPARPGLVSRRVVLVGVVAAVVLATLAAVFVGSRLRDGPPPLRANGHIAFDWEGSIWLAEADGTGAREIEAADELFAPAYSPDGTRLAFWSRPEAFGGLHLVVAKADGSDPIDITGETSAFAGSATYDPPSWSPDGRQLVFSGLVRGLDGLWIANADGSGSAAITGPGANRFSPVWSPAGEWIAFALEVGTGPRRAALAIIRPDGTDERHLVELEGAGLPSGSPTWPTFSFQGSAWSPDGTRIAYHIVPGTIGVVDLAGSATIVVADGALEASLSWSPDGAHLAFRDDADVYVIRPDGSDRRTVDVAVAQCAYADPRGGVNATVWSPDGTRVIGSTGTACAGIGEPSGGAPVALVTSTGDARPARAVAWQSVDP